MARVISRDELRSMLERGDDFCLIDVRTPEAYDDYHLPRAMNVPFDEHFDRSIVTACPDRDQLLVVYCYDRDSPISADAIRRMERLCYRRLLHYTCGQAEWRASGLHGEGASAHPHGASSDASAGSA